jgi:hypothetical protein
MVPAMFHAARSLVVLTFSSLIAFGGVLVGCDDASTATGSTSASATTTSSAPSAKPKASVAPVTKPDPLDLATIKKSLKCSDKTASGPCPVLAKFEKCKEGWSPITVSGDGRWIGHGAVAKKGQFVEEYMILRARRVGLADVAPGALGVKIGITEPPTDAGMRASIGQAFRALNRGDTVKLGNHAIEYVHTLNDWPEAYAQQADDHQIFVATGAGAYLCGDPATQALYVVRLSSSSEHPGDGFYATLYPTKW